MDILTLYIVGEVSKRLTVLGDLIFPFDIKHHGIKPDYVLRAAQKVDYLVTDIRDRRKTGFYIGDTDNFGHWLFEFLPKALWYKKLFPDQNIPLMVGESVLDKWLQLLVQLEINLTVKCLYKNT